MTLLLQEKRHATDHEFSKIKPGGGTLKVHNHPMVKGSLAGVRISKAIHY